MGYDFGQGLKGAGGGALAGASAGSMFGPWGTAIGGIGGGILGALGGIGANDQNDQARGMLMDYYKQIQGRGTPQMGPAAQGRYSDARSQQGDLVNRLTAMSKGEGPSLAMEQLKQSTDRLGSQQSSIANSGRGGPLAAQVAANNTGLIGAQAAQSGMQGRIQEQQGALQALGLNLHGMRGADEEMNRFNAGQTNQQAQQNLWARLKSMGMQDEAALKIIGQLQGQNTAEGSRVGTGDQLLAGGAGMFSQYATQNAQNSGGMNDPSKYWQGSTRTGSPYGA